MRPSATAGGDGERLVVTLGRHEHPGRRVAGLAAVGEAGFDALADRRGKVRVAEDDVRRLAAEFLRHPLDRVRRGLCDEHPGAGRAGERDHVDAGMRRHRLTDLRPRPVDEIEHAPGRSAASTISAKIRPLIGAISLGFRTTAHPAASAGATLQTIWFSGQFHGVIRAATPIGSRKSGSIRCGG